MIEQRRLAAIVSADVASYSRLMGRDESGTLAALKAIRQEVVDPAIASHVGRIVKTTGDGLLLEFPSVVNAVRCAVEVQMAMTYRTAGVAEDRRIAFRIGINIGDIIVDGDDIFGDGVNVAARLQEIAPPGGICISSRVHEDVRDRLQTAFDDGGTQTLKNIARPVQVWSWRPGQNVPSELAPTRAALPLPDKPSVAVLPFQNMSGDPEQEYFVDGLVEDIITALSRVKWFFVIARNSSFTYKGKPVDIRRIGQDLGVRYILEGSIRKAGNRVRLTAQLIDAPSGSHLWADKYDGTLDQIFDLQDQIVEKLIGAIEPKLRLSETARSRQKRPESLQAFDLVLQAMHNFTHMTTESLEDGIGLLDRAIVLEPNYAHALGLAASIRAHRALFVWGANVARDMEESVSLSRRALDADPEDPMALRTAASTAVLVNRDYQGSLDLVDRSLDVDANSAMSWGIRGYTNIYSGEFDQAVSDLQKALRLSPYDQWGAQYSAGVAFALLIAGRSEEALRWVRKAVQLNPQWMGTQRVLIGALALVGQLSEAQAAAKEYLKIEPNFSVSHFAERMPYRRTAGYERYWAALRRAGLPE